MFFFWFVSNSTFIFTNGITIRMIIATVTLNGILFLVYLASILNLRSFIFFLCTNNENIGVDFFKFFVFEMKISCPEIKQNPKSEMCLVFFLIFSLNAYNNFRYILHTNHFWLFYPINCQTNTYHTGARDMTINYEYAQKTALAP